MIDTNGDAVGFARGARCSTSCSWMPRSRPERSYEKDLRRGHCVGWRSSHWNQGAHRSGTAVDERARIVIGADGVARWWPKPCSDAGVRREAATRCVLLRLLQRLRCRRSRDSTSATTRASVASRHMTGSRSSLRCGPAAGSGRSAPTWEARQEGASSPYPAWRTGCSAQHSKRSGLRRPASRTISVSRTARVGARRRCGIRQGSDHGAGDQRCVHRR